MAKVADRTDYMLPLNRLLYRLIIITVESGAATTTLSIITLILLHVTPRTSIALVLGGCTGRCSALTMIYNLNMRGSGGHLMHTSTLGEKTATALPPTYPLGTFASRADRSRFDGGVSVHQTMQVQIDDVG